MPSVSRKCKGCDRDISHKHPNAKFHSKRCKDKYHNATNPRGMYAHLNENHPNHAEYLNEIGIEGEGYGWDGYKDSC